MKTLPILTAVAALATALSAGQAQAGQLVVNDGTPDATKRCQKAADHTSVQDAIDAATPGSMIRICPGTYVEDLEIFTDNLKLVGEERDTTIIQGVATSAGPFPLAVPNIDLQANGVQIRNLTIMSPPSATGTYASGLVIDGRNVQIRDNEFVVSRGDPGSVAIQTWREANGSLGDISGLKIQNNSFTSQDSTEGFGYEGIFINPQSLPSDPEEAVSIKRNDFSGALYRAIGIERPDVTPHRNTMSTELPVTDVEIFGGDVPLGIKLFAGDNHSVKRNMMWGEGDGVFAAGLTVTAGSNENSVVKNRIQAVVGVVLAGDRNKVVNNRITTEEDGTGVAVVGSTHNKVTNNKITCGLGAIGVSLDAGTVENKVNNNRFTNCGATAVDDQGTDNRVKLRKN